MNHRLIALDWGTTNLRACLFATGQEISETRSAQSGILQIQDQGFEHALMRLCHDWMTANTVLLASGMIGSRQGWRETPYLRTPAGPAEAARALAPVRMTNGMTVWLVPGIHHVDEAGVDDVMRGEETQIWGDSPGGPGIVILPGTHSKWVNCAAGGSIVGFRTWMTGEMFSVLCSHSILGRLMQQGPFSADSFDLGVRRGFEAPEQLGRLIFSVRTAGLTQRLPADGLADYLSGLLIGAEFGAARRCFGLQPINDRPARVPRIPLRLVGEALLCDRYGRAAALAGFDTVVAPPALAARGAWRIAQHAGLISFPAVQP